MATPKPRLRDAARAYAAQRRADRYEGMRFSPGVVVTLTCGGAKMTVLDCRAVCDGEPQVDLIWSAFGGHDLGKATLPAACLIEAIPPDIPF